MHTQFSYVSSKFCQILIKPSKSCQIVLTFSQRTKFRQIWSHWTRGGPLKAQLFTVKSDIYCSNVLKRPLGQRPLNHSFFFWSKKFTKSLENTNQRKLSWERERVQLLKRLNDFYNGQSWTLYLYFRIFFLQCTVNNC